MKEHTLAPEGFLARFVRARIVKKTKPSTRCNRTEAEWLVEQAKLMDTRLKVVEAERDRAQYELERLFHFIPALLIFKSCDGVLLRVNEHTASAFNCTPEDMVGKHQSEFYPPEQVAAFEKDDAEILRTGEGRHGYIEDVAWRGEVHRFRTWKVPIYNGSPIPLGVMLFAVDLTWVCGTISPLQPNG